MDSLFRVFSDRCPNAWFTFSLYVCVCVCAYVCVGVCVCANLSVELSQCELDLIVPTVVCTTIVSP